MKNFLASRKHIWIFAAIAILAVAAAVATRYLPAGNKKLADSSGNEVAKLPPEKASPAIDSKSIAPEQTPDLFPKDMPIEKGAKVISNYNATIADGRYQGTKVFQTSNSVDENYALYENYFKTHGWTVSGGPALDQKIQAKILLATKDSFQAQVILGPDQTTKVNTVSISIVKLASPTK